MYALVVEGFRRVASARSLFGGRLLGVGCPLELLHGELTGVLGMLYGPAGRAAVVADELVTALAQRRNAPAFVGGGGKFPLSRKLTAALQR